MKQIHILIVPFILFTIFTKTVNAQPDDADKLKLSGELKTDQRFLFKSPNDWAWNENRLSIDFDKKIKGNSKFHSEVWLRNIGLPNVHSSADLYNKGIVDPYSLEIREAYFEVFGFLTPKLDIKIGRQRIAWGTADKFNPTDNLNPYDMEDVLDFGRHRGSDAINLNYYLNSDFSLQAVFIPIFQPANMPVGIFANALKPAITLPQGLTLKEANTEVFTPEYNLKESSTLGFKVKGFLAGFDFSVSYVWGRDGLPISSYNAISPVDTIGGVSLNSHFTFTRNHIFGADLAGSIGGVGIWAEAAAFLPDYEVVMVNDMTAMNPLSSTGIIQVTTVLKKEVYLKYIVGADYHFANGMYLNFQYMHGFITERGNDALNDYFFLKVDKKFFDEKLKITPLAGGFIVTDWEDVENNYTIVYVPEISYMATDNAEIILSAAIFEGKGKGTFSNFIDYDMMMLKFKYSF